MPRTRIALCALVVCLPLAGCLITHHQHKIVREDEPMRDVAFASDDARVEFDQVARDDDARLKEGGGSIVAIPFLLWWSTTTVKSPAAWYNDHISACDTDHDGQISEVEARAYASNHPRDDTQTASDDEEEADRLVKRVKHSKMSPTHKSRDLSEPSVNEVSDE